MESNQERQLQEITVLRSIYDHDYQECAPPKAWKGAARMPEFTIRIRHPDPAHEEDVYCHLLVKLPKTYPSLASATCTAQPPMIGISPAILTRLNSAIHTETQKLKGQEAVFTIVQFAQDWIGTHITPAVENPHSLATEAAKRAEEQERVQQHALSRQQAEEQERAAQLASDLQSQIKADADRRAAAVATSAPPRRPRANTDATEVPESLVGDTPIETFAERINCDGVTFNSVKLFHPRRDILGTTYAAEPICDDVRVTLPLEVVVITFDSRYYSSPAGRKKLQDLEPELHRLRTMRHPNLLSLYAVKFHISSDVGQGSSRLVLLCEQAPPINLADVLDDVDGIREEKVIDYMKQILGALQALHAVDIPHRGLALECIGLASRSSSITPSASHPHGNGSSHDSGSTTKLVKLARAGWLVRILSLHRSNAISAGLPPTTTGPGTDDGVPEGWLTRECLESPLAYTKARDVHDAGMVMMQLLLGRDVYRRFQEPRSALSFSTLTSPSTQSFVLSLLLQTKRHAMTAAQALIEIAEPSTRRHSSRSPALTITPAVWSPRMPVPRAARTPLPMQVGVSPPDSYFVGEQAGSTPVQHLLVPQTARIPPIASRAAVPHSRWREEWDQLEILGSGAFGSVKKARHRLDGRTYAVKQIRLRRVPAEEANGPAASFRDDKLWREVDTLSRLNHPRIVRYFGTWLEFGEADENATGDDTSSSMSGSGSDSASGSGTEDGFQRRPAVAKSDDGDDSKLFAPSWWQEEEDRTTNGTWKDHIAPGIMSRSTSQSTSASVSTTASTNISRSTSFRGDSLYRERDDFGSGGGGASQTGSARTSFTSIIFEDGDGSDEEKSGSSSEDESDGGIVFEMDYDTIGDTIGSRSPTPSSPAAPPPVPKVSRTLYIQMEYVEQGTLKERIAMGPIDETECWRMFGQIVDALIHIARQGILHRDIKLTNIFIDSRGDCKLGDFGLATSSLELGQPEEQTKSATSQGLLAVPKVVGTEMTLEVGTRLYIAPEVQRQKGRSKPQDHSKADVYSLGIVFFEMNYGPFKTDSERIYVIEDVRKPEIIFPSGWPAARVRQKSIVTWLLQHEPSKRPTALELSQSDLVPARVEDENIKSALSMIAKSDSPHFQAVLNTLFHQPIVPTRSFTYDAHHDIPEHTSLNGVVKDKLAEIFRLHGAVDVEPLLLLPVNTEADRSKVVLLDKHGDPLVLPDNGILPLARLAARRDITRIKRFHIGDVYKPSSASGHPQVFKSAVYDVISPDLQTGPITSSAEVIGVLDECLNAFPTLDQDCEIRISHAKIKHLVFGSIPPDLRADVTDILQQTKSSASQKRAQMLAKGLLRSVADELEVLNDNDTDIDALASRIEKTSPSLALRIAAFVEEIRQTLQFISVLNVTTPIVIHPLLPSKDHYFKDGICFDVIRRKKRTDIIASGGRYDSLIDSLALQKGPGSRPVCAIGVQIAVDNIVRALATYQSVSVKNLIKEHRSFGFWSPRRCDVYVVSFQPGYMQERLEIASLLWRHGVSADMMYEHGLADLEHENHLDMCAREGILFTVYPRPRSARRDQLPFKVKSVLKGTEYELSRQDLVTWLQQQIAEQKRIDATTSGVTAPLDLAQSAIFSKELPASSDVQLILPGDAKKQRKQTKQMFLDRAFETAANLKSSVQAGLQVLAVDVPSQVFDALIKDAGWVTDDEAWRAIAATFPVGQSAYAQQCRESASKRRADGHAFLLLVAVREERVGLIAF